MIIKKSIFTVFCIGLFVLSGFAQKSAAPVKPVKPSPIQNSILTEIPEAEWKNLTDALKAETWEKSAALAAQYLQKIKIDNAKKQLAQLRYFYLYALAGKILALSSAGKTPEEDAAWQELDKTVSEFNGKEFVLPPRRFLPECGQVLNYICTVKNNDRALRVTATNQAGTDIHSFDYILFDGKDSFGNLPETNVFLGGKLKRAEFNQDLSKRWVMRLLFDRGFVSYVAADGK